MEAIDGNQDWLVLALVAVVLMLLVLALVVVAVLVVQQTGWEKRNSLPTVQDRGSCRHASPGQPA